MRIGIAGAGNIVNDMLRGIKGIDNIAVGAIYARSNRNGHIDDLCRDYSIPKAYYNYDEMLNDDNIDTVYVAVTNDVHFEFSKKALEKGKNVICEKPFTVNKDELNILVNIAEEKDLFLFEAITNIYLPNFLAMKQKLKELGNIRIIECNYSQYSSRYDEFKKGNILPAFDVNRAGGALMDLNVYNVHLITELCGKPEKVEYYPNIERGVDVSGILILSYDKFKCVCIGAKDCSAPLSTNIQGDAGCIHIDKPTNTIKDFFVISNNGHEEKVDANGGHHKMYHEFKAFSDMVDNNDKKAMREKLEHSLVVMDVLTEARKKIVNR